MNLLERARALQVGFPATVSTPYVNSIPPDEEPWFPGDELQERRIRAYIRWNAAVMVTRANARDNGIGGHLSTYASSAALYEVGFNHFFHGKDNEAPGDQVYFQGHASPGIYARAFVEGRLDEEHLDNFRFEVAGQGLSSYPHPRRLPDFWEFPTVSMGLGPISAVYQARLNRYLLHHELVDTSGSTVWCFVGDGEFDEPETKAGLAIAAREKLDNLIFVVNCNLQRLDGPVRGNGKIIQELEAEFRGNGWNVIKVIWGSRWDELLARDVDGVLLNKMNTTLDGDFQKYATESGAYIREHFFGPDPRLRALVEHLSDDDLQSLPRGGHDYRKLYSAYKAATEQVGAPTVILAKTIKGWTLGTEIEARNATHQIKKMTHEQLRILRDRLYLARGDPRRGAQCRGTAVLPTREGLAGLRVHGGRRKQLGGSLPIRNRARRRPEGLAGTGCEPRSTPSSSSGSRGQPVSTTMAFARMLRSLLRDKNVGKFVVPIIPDEGRTFGLDALFSEVKIYAPGGQRYTSVDAGLLLQYAESEEGQILEEGITEAGSMASFIAAATSYATWARPMLPFFMYYSMFGFQRVGDLIWQCADARGRGFLMGCTAGRTTINGEGLQHEDGHSHLLASVIPTVRAYDAAFAYEMAIIVEHGIDAMYGPNGEDVIYYLTLYNENYVMPDFSNEDIERVREGAIRGLYRFAATPRRSKDCKAAKAPARNAAVLWQCVARGDAGARHPRRRVERRDRGVVGDELEGTAGGRARDRALESPAPESRTSPRALHHLGAFRRAARSSRSPTS